MIRVVQVGIGGMGNHWLETVLDSSEVEFAGFVEINEAIAAEQTARHKLNGHTVFRTLPEALAALRADGVDGVIDVTPPAFHREVAQMALEVGIPVLSEKPLSNTLEDAKAIVALSNSTGILHMVAQNYRYNPPTQTVKQVLESGDLGDLTAVNVQFFKGAHFDGFRAVMPYPLIIDMSIHHFDMLRFFMDSEPVSIFGRSWNPPGSWLRGDAAASVSLELANGVRVSYNASWVALGGGTTWNGDWRFDGSNGTLSMQGDQVSRVKPLVGVFDSSLGEAEPQPLFKMPLTQQAYLLHEFHDAVRHGVQPATTCQDNIRSLALVFDIVRAFEAGVPVASSMI